MVRRATYFKQERKNTQGILLALDAGATLFGRWLTQRSEGKAMVEAMNILAYDAMLVGQVDLTLGLDITQQREAEAKFPFLSANLVDNAEKKPVFKPYVVLERAGAKIGILGISEMSAAQAPNVANKATVLNPTETAKRYVTELRPNVDVLIVLSRLGIEGDHALAKAVPGIDIIVGGATRKLMEVPEREGNTLIVQQGYDGEWVGRLQVTYDAQGTPSKISETLITLGPEFADDEEMVAAMKKWIELYPSPTPPPTPTPDPRTPTVTPFRPVIIPTPTRKP